MMGIYDNPSPETEKKLATVKSDECRKLFAYLLLAGKNMSLYPEGHSTAANSVRLFHAKLDACIRLFGDFKIEIERDRVLCQGVEVHKGPLEERTIPFTLFRDGIRWLEFEEGISLDETREVFSIINRFSVLSAESEGDIVTDFWEARFVHVQYEAVDFFPGLGPEQQDDLFASDARRAVCEGGSDRMSPTDPSAEVGEGFVEERPVLPGPPAIDPDLLVLNPRELSLLQDMIHREETASASSHLNMLLDSLLQFREESDFRVILEVLSEEFPISLVRHDFEAALLILEGLRYVHDSGRIAAVWARPLIESIIDKISDNATLKPLEEIWQNIDEHQAGVLERVFQRLHPRAMGTLAALLIVPQPPQLEKMVEESLMDLARQDESHLELLIRNSDEKIAARLVPVLYKLGEDVSGNYLLKLARHSSPPVRRMALKAMVYGRRIRPEEMVQFVDDEDEALRRLIFRQLGQARNSALEERLLHYLQNRKFSSAQSEQALECLKTLGKCGSLRSVPFLRETLRRRKWIAGLEKSLFREGALAALAALKIPEANQVIEEAGKSFYPGLRKIARDIIRKSFPKEKGGG